ncbi:hypothetical protein GW17_00003501 [Ensete ventricosum]|nr:hypothetical protein GW17_00003501 [Ensete ventricosum]
MPSVFGTLEQFISTFKEAGISSKGKLCTCDVSKVLKIMFSPNPYQVIQLRKACSHPYLFTGIEPEPYEEGEHLVQVIENLGLL